MATNLIELIQASCLQPVVTTLRRRGIDVEHYLEEVYIPPELLRLSYAPLSKRNQIWSFLELVEEREGLETLGFLLGDRMDLLETGPFGVCVSHAATLYDAIKTVQRLVPDFSQGDFIHLRREGRRAWISIETPKKPLSRPGDHYGLKYLLALVRLTAGPDWCPEQAKLETDEVQAIFELPSFKNCKLQFNQSECAIAVPTPYLSRPLRPTLEIPDGGLPRMLPLPDTGRLADSLRVIVASQLSHRGPPSANEAAAIAGVSRSTLFRHLAAEGTTYREIVRRVRYEVAQKLLRDSEMHVKEIGYRLGYSTPNNFIRSFRAVAGVSPNVFRQESLAE